MYHKHIVEENDLDEIMEFVRKNPRNIEKYADMLVTKFKDEVGEIYKTHIESVASASPNRKDYQGVCGILKRYKKIEGKEKQEEMMMFYLCNDMIVPGSIYWNIVLGQGSGKALKDEEGIKTVKKFAENIAYLIFNKLIYTTKYEACLYFFVKFLNCKYML